MMKSIRKHRKKLAKVILFLGILLFFLTIMIWYYTVKVTPILSTMGLTKSKWLAVNAISTAVNDRLANEDLDYDDVAILEKNKNGDIIAIKTDIVKLNKIQADLAAAINNKLHVDEIDLYIPIGNILDNQVLTGWGPKIKFRLIPSGGVTTKIENLFTSAGINQTRHQIMLTINVNASVLLPMYTQSTTIETSICVAETVLVGNVPDTYLTGDGTSGINISPNAQ